MSRKRVLVVDDDRAVRSVLKVNLGKHGLRVDAVTNSDEALVALRSEPYDLMLTDVMMPGTSGMELLAQVRTAYPELPVVVMTGYGSVEDAVGAMKGGASDYIIKPIARDELLLIVDRALDARALRDEVQQLRQAVNDRYGFENLIGATPAMVDLYEQIAAVADSTATVLLEGPTGTGKELLASAVHYRSPRASAPFVRVNCAAIPESLLESELFGHEKGAFTGAIRQHHGKFEQADGGTLLLDEIGEINAYTQVKLLRILENGEFQRVGGQVTQQVDVRVIASTNKDLAIEAKEGRFRKDLFFRLNVVRLRVPSLAERRDDIPLLTEHFLEKYAVQHNREGTELSANAMEKLTSYSWPGNVRQLEHAIERALILCRDGLIDDIPLDQELVESFQDAPPTLLPPQGVTLQEALKEHEKKLLLAALEECDGVQARAARRLGLTRSNLAYRLNRLGIHPNG